MTSSQEVVVDVGIPADLASTDEWADEHLGGGLVDGRLAVSTRATRPDHPSPCRAAT